MLPVHNGKNKIPGQKQTATEFDLLLRGHYSKTIN